MPDATSPIRTRILGLLKIRPGIDEPAKNDGEFFNGNLDRLDQAFGLASSHRHDASTVGGAGSPDAPDAELSTTDGGIAGSTTVLYRVSVVDAAGQEGPASSSTEVDTPANLDTPEAPTLARIATGGSHVPGYIQYAVSAWRRFHTFETLAAAAATANLPPSDGDEQQVVITFPDLPDGADGFNIYRRLQNSTIFVLLATVAAADAGDPFIDDGSIDTSNERLSPRTDTSGAGNAIDVTPAGTLATGETWRIYRSYQEDAEPVSWLGSLLAELPEGGPTSFTDLGGPTTAESPVEGAGSFTNPGKVDIVEETTGQLPAERVAYTPETPGDWTDPPEDAQAALDQLGARTSGGGFQEVILFTATAADGTATEITTLTPDSSSPGQTTYPNAIPAGYRADATIPVTGGMGSLASIIAASPDGAVTLLAPGGQLTGAWRLTTTTVLTDPWPAVDVPLAKQSEGNWRAIQGSSGDWVTIDRADPLGPGFPGDVFIGPAAEHGGTYELAEGEAVFVPLLLANRQVIDGLRVGTSIAGSTGTAKAMLYLAVASQNVSWLPGEIVGSAEIDVDTIADIIGTIAANSVPASLWWLGIHNHIAGADPATFHAYAASARFPELPAPAPSSTDGYTGISADAGTDPITNADSLTFTPISQAPIIQARTD